jgi:hypothetical protein
VTDVTAARPGAMLPGMTALSLLSERSVESVRGALKRTSPELSGGSIALQPENAQTELTGLPALVRTRRAVRTSEALVPVIRPSARLHAWSRPHHKVLIGRHEGVSKDGMISEVKCLVSRQVTWSLTDTGPFTGWSELPPGH